MPIPLTISPVKLTKTQKAIITDYLQGKSYIKEACAKLGITHQRMYTMMTAVLRDASRKEFINIKDVLKNY